MTNIIRHNYDIDNLNILIDKCCYLLENSDLKNNIKISCLDCLSEIYEINQNKNRNSINELCLNVSFNYL